MNGTASSSQDSPASASHTVMMLHIDTPVAVIAAPGTAGGTSTDRSALSPPQKTYCEQEFHGETMSCSMAQDVGFVGLGWRICSLDAASHSTAQESHSHEHQSLKESALCVPAGSKGQIEIGSVLMKQ